MNIHNIHPVAKVAMIYTLGIAARDALAWQNDGDFVDYNSDTYKLLEIKSSEVFEEAFSTVKSFGYRISKEDFNIMIYEDNFFELVENLVGVKVPSSVIGND